MEKSCRQSDQASVFTGFNTKVNKRAVVKRFNLHKENDSFKREVEVLSKYHLSLSRDENEEGGKLPKL